MADVDDRQLRGLIDDIEKNIVIPEPKGEKFLLCPVGIIGAGKTTVVKPLAEKLGLVRISNDEIRKTLKEAEYDLEYARNGSEGLSKIPTFEPDMMIVDLKLPEMDGFQILERLRKDHRELIERIEALNGRLSAAMEE